MGIAERDVNVTEHLKMKKTHYFLKYTMLEMNAECGTSEDSGTSRVVIFYLEFYFAFLCYFPGSISLSICFLFLSPFPFFPGFFLTLAFSPMKSSRGFFFSVIGLSNNDASSQRFSPVKKKKEWNRVIKRERNRFGCLATSLRRFNCARA